VVKDYLFTHTQAVSIIIRMKFMWKCG